MFVLLNTYAGGGKAGKRWSNFLRSGLVPGSATIFSGRSTLELKQAIINALREGETHFTAGGGDGTVNLLLNTLYNCTDAKQFQDVSLGAVGIGSSNDFHKPFRSVNSRNVSHRINYYNLEDRDICFINYETRGIQNKRLFMINASIGLTAEGNKYFNYPDKVLNIMKKVSTDAAIYLAALKTVLMYKKIRVSISSPVVKNFTTKLSNLGVAKNPHFAGDLRYEFSPDYNKGLFNIILFHRMTMPEHLFLFFKLAGGGTEQIRKQISWEDKKIKITSRDKFGVEFDGETIETTSAEFGILEQKIKVCSC